MWNLIFELLCYFLVTVCCYKVAKSYGSKFKQALRDLRHFEIYSGRLVHSYQLDYWRYLSASLAWEGAVLIAIYAFLTKATAFYALL